MNRPVENDRSISLLYLLTGALQHEMGLAEQDACRHAQAMVRWMAPQVGGDVLYCPKTIEADRVARDEAIRKEFNGRNGGEVCQRHGISRTTLYRVVAKSPVEPLNVGRDAA